MDTYGVAQAHATPKNARVKDDSAGESLTCSPQWDQSGRLTRSNQTFAYNRRVSTALCDGIFAPISPIEVVKEDHKCPQTPSQAISQRRLQWHDQAYTECRVQDGIERPAHPARCSRIVCTKSVE